MAKNITWCLLKNSFSKIKSVQIHLFFKQFNRFQHTKENLPQHLVNCDYREVKSYKEFLIETQTGSHVAVTTLIKLFGIAKENAINTVNMWKDFQSLSVLSLKTNNNILIEAGVKKSTLRKNIYALANETQYLRLKIEILESMGLNINESIPLLQLTIIDFFYLKEIHKTDKNILDKDPNRIAYLSRRLKCDIYDFCNIVNRNTNTLFSPIDKIIMITDFLLDQMGVAEQYILNDITVYSYNYSTMREKMLRAKRAGISPLKPWILRTSSSFIEKAEKKKITRENIIDSGQTLAEYISGIFNCKIELVHALLERDKKIENMQIEKLSTVIKFLRDSGYTITDIYRSPTVLHKNLKILKEKYDIWMQSGLGRPYLYVLTCGFTKFKYLKDIKTQKQSITKTK